MARRIRAGARKKNLLKEEDAFVVHFQKRDTADKGGFCGLEIGLSESTIHSLSALLLFLFGKTLSMFL